MKNKKLLQEAHPALPTLVEGLDNHPHNRRRFLRTATLLGLSASSAYLLASKILGEDAGIIPVAEAQEPEAAKAQILRVAMTVPPITDPAKYEFTEMANITRHICEYLTISDPDASAQVRLNALTDLPSGCISDSQRFPYQKILQPTLPPLYIGTSRAILEKSR